MCALISRLRIEQNKENKMEPQDSLKFFSFLDLSEEDKKFLTQFSKVRVVAVNPNQLELVTQIQRHKPLSYVHGYKIILKSQMSHIHIVKIVDQDGKFVEYQAGATEGVNISEYASVLNGMIAGTPDGQLLFDEVVQRFL